MSSSIPSEITREHIEQAIRDFDAGASHVFGSSTFYNLLHEGRRYPPKAILALAAKCATGVILRPQDFSGGVRSRCFRVLEGAGFEIARKKP